MRQDPQLHSLLPLPLLPFRPLRLLTLPLQLPLPRVELLRTGPICEIEAQTRALLTGPVKQGRFVLRDANNLAPGTPPEHVAAMYETARKYGRYD